MRPLSRLFQKTCHKNKRLRCCHAEGRGEKIRSAAGKEKKSDSTIIAEIFTEVVLREESRC